MIEADNEKIDDIIDFLTNECFVKKSSRMFSEISGGRIHWYSSSKYRRYLKLSKIIDLDFNFDEFFNEFDDDHTLVMYYNSITKSLTLNYHLICQSLGISDYDLVTSEEMQKIFINRIIENHKDIYDFKIDKIGNRILNDIR